MSTADRRARHSVLPRSGARLDESTMRWWMGELDRRNPRVRVERLSANDPFCQAVEAESRDRERVA